MQTVGLETAQRPKGGIRDTSLPKQGSEEIRMAAKAIRRNFNFLGQLAVNPSVSELKTKERD